MGDYYGYLILGIFAFIFIGISVIVSKKFPAEGVDDFVAAGRGIPSALIAASVMVSWVWTTTLMGSAEAGMNFGISGGLNYAWGNAVPFFMKLVYGGGLGAIVFVLMVFMAGMTTGGGCLSGLQALFTADFYKKYINKSASEKQMMSFGKKITFAAGALVIVIALLLKGHSLLMLDIFSGILFAAPASSFVAGVYFKKTTPAIAITSIVCGLGSGLAAYFLIPNDDINWFVGNILALLVPAVIVIIGSLFSRHSFDFKKLEEYVPDHAVNR